MNSLPCRLMQLIHPDEIVRKIPSFLSLSSHTAIFVSFLSSLDYVCSKFKQQQKNSSVNIYRAVLREPLPKKKCTTSIIKLLRKKIVSHKIFFVCF